MQLTNKAVIVTGASDGIGREIALALGKRGINVALVARNADKLNSVLSELIKLGVTNSHAYICDLQKPTQIKSVFAQIISDYGPDLMGLVNNAGIWQKKALLPAIPDREIRDVIETNLLGVIHTTKVVLPHFLTLPEAAVINVSSRSGCSAQPLQSVYSAAKWGVKGFTEVLKVDLQDTHVHVAGVYQGGTNTAMFNKTGEDFSPEKLASFIPADSLGELIATMLTLPAQTWISEIHVNNK